MPEHGSHAAEPLDLGQQRPQSRQYFGTGELQIVGMMQGGIHHKQRNFQKLMRLAPLKIEGKKWVAVGVAEAVVLGKAQRGIVGQAGGGQHGGRPAGFPAQVVEAVAGHRRWPQARRLCA